MCFFANIVKKLNFWITSIAEQKKQVQLFWPWNSHAKFDRSTFELGPGGLTWNRLNVI